MKSHRRPLLAAVLVSVCLTTTARSDEFKAVDPATVGFNAEKLGAIDKAMQKQVNDGKAAGCLALVVRNDKVAYFKMWGDRDREAKKKMTADTIFRIYSMSKPITSVAVMILVERGKIDLDAPLSKHLPEFADKKVLVVKNDDDGNETTEEVPAKREVTARDLLRHTSGLTYGFFARSAVDTKYLQARILGGKNIGEMVTKLGKIPLKHQPGAQWEYSVSTDVLGRLVEVASGERFDRFLEKNIFKPLGMKDTSFMVPKEKMDRFSQMYSPDGDSLKPAAERRSRRFVDPNNEFFSGGGGLCSTTRDYLRFCQMMLNDGELDGKRILKPESAREMHTNQLGKETKRRPGFQFGLGYAISPEGRYSWGGAAGTRFWIDPENKLIGIFMIQINPYRGNHGDQMRRLVYAALEK